MAFGIVVLFVIGLISVAFPRWGWALSKWQYRNPDAVEPSDASFAVGRIAGVVLILIAIGLVIDVTRHGSSAKSQSNDPVSALVAAGLPENQAAFQFDKTIEDIVTAENGYDKRQPALARKTIQALATACAGRDSGLDYCTIPFVLAADYASSGHVTMRSTDGTGGVFCLTEPSGVDGSYYSSVADGACRPVAPG